MNNFFTPDLIFFVLVAAFLILRLRSVLGRRTGNEKKSKDFFLHQDASSIGSKKKIIQEKQLIKNKETETFVKKDNLELKSKTSLETIHYYDKNFSPNKFLSGAKKAFELIIESYAKGEINKIKHLISTNIFSIFSKEIKLRIKKKNSLEHSLVSIKSADIEKINVKSSIADIVVKFLSEQVNLLKNEKGNILKGNDEYIENHTDYWTFSKDLKSNNPNWKLVVTKTG